jgi:hypothetical protein
MHTVAKLVGNDTPTHYTPNVFPCFMWFSNQTAQVPSTTPTDLPSSNRRCVFGAARTQLLYNI